MLPFRIENITQPIIVYYTNVLHYKIEGNIRGCRDRDLQLPMQSLSITTNVASSNPAHDDVYSIQHNECDKICQ